MPILERWVLSSIINIFSNDNSTILSRFLYIYLFLTDKTF